MSTKDEEEILFSYSTHRKSMSNEEVEELVAQELEKLAQHIRSKKWPRICSFDIKKQKQGPFTDVRLLLSFPWGA